MRSLEAPDLAPAGSLPSGRVYEIDVRVSWDPQRQIEIRTLRTVPADTQEVTLPANQGTLPGAKGTMPGATPSGTKPTGTTGTSSPGQGLLPSLGGRTR